MPMMVSKKFNIFLFLAKTKHVIENIKQKHILNI